MSWYFTAVQQIFGMLLQVAREVYNTCITGALASKTRLLGTKQLKFVSGANSVVYM